jgi:hypothetical protein
MKYESLKLTSVGQVIATRELDIADGSKVLVTIGIPQPFPELTSFYCPYQIDGLGKRHVRYAGGVDAVQALELAMKCIATDLYTSDAFKSDKLRHLGMRNLGFPYLDAIAELVPPENE